MAYTERNPSLVYKDEYGQTAYKPAWLLENGLDERTGRNPQSPK